MKLQNYYFVISNTLYQDFKYDRKYFTVTFEWVQKDLVIFCLWFKREFWRKTLDSEKVFLLKKVEL